VAAPVSARRLLAARGAPTERRLAGARSARRGHPVLHLALPEVRCALAQAVARRHLLAAASQDPAAVFHLRAVAAERLGPTMAVLRLRVEAVAVQRPRLAAPGASAALAGVLPWGARDATVREPAAAQCAAAVQAGAAARRAAVPSVGARDAAAPRPAAGVPDEAEVRRPGAAVQDAAVPQPGAAVPAGVEGARRRAARGVAEQRPAARASAAARPSAAAWACRRDPILPSPVPSLAERIGRAMWRWQTARPSARSWQAARDEGLSSGSRK